MIKKILLGMTLLMAMVSCTEDYTDWGKPQTNPQEEAVTFGNGSISAASAINLAEVTTPTVKVASITAPTADGGYAASGDYKITLGGKTLDMNAAGEVSTEELQSLIVDNFGKAPEQREFDAKAVTWITNGQNSVKIESEAFKVQAAPKAANIEAAYYLASDATGWTLDAVKANAFTHSETNRWDDPNFKFVLTTTEDNQEFMIVPASSLEKSNVLDGAFGCKVEGDDSANGDLTNEGAQKIVIANAGKYIITVNMESKTYSIAEAPQNLFLTGSNYGWGDTWKQLVPVWGTTDRFWIIIYLHEGEEFKFAPQAGWGDDFGMQATVKDEAGAGLSGDGNCVVGKAGWYLLVVTNGVDRVIEVRKPEVYLMGDTAGDWSIMESAKFSVPATDDGDFVSPAFVKDAALRMCVNVDEGNWWHTEFTVSPSGNIDYRGREGDQYAVNVKAGQKAYLNFTTGKAEVK